MPRRELQPLSGEQRREIAAWIKENSHSLPESVRIFLDHHQPYLAAGDDPRRALETVYRELRRALGVTPSSEKRPSRAPNAGLPREGAEPRTEQERLAALLARSDRLGDWHRELKRRHRAKAKRLRAKLANMPTATGPQDDITEDTPVEEIELTDEEKAEAKAAGALFVQHILMGNGADPALKAVNETLMPAGAVHAQEEHVELPAAVPPDLAEAKVLKTLTETRVRYDFSVAVTRIELDVEKKVLADKDGERHVITASTREFGPPRFSVTWSALATLAVLVGQFALPLNRLGTLLSTPVKRFTAAGLSRMLRYVGERLLPVYLQLARELSDSGIIAGDDTSCRVIEVSAHLAKPAAKREEPPWAEYRTPDAAEKTIRRCAEKEEHRRRRRDDGDREAKRSPDETPSLGVLIGRHLPFESPLRNGNGAKQAMHTTVASGRAVADDPRSLIVFYRSHLGSFGNLLEAVLSRRAPAARDIVIQGDLSTTNLVVSPALHARFFIRAIGCMAHARRPFANYEHEDPVPCAHILHLFTGLAMHEARLDVHGRNRENVLAVRQNESRELWNDILELSREIAEKWSPATKLGTAARYIINHFDKLTAYLDDPHLEPTNNLRERMLRPEKLIEGSSMFRRSLEGRFVLDIVRTVLQTAVAAGVPVHEYVTSLLRTDSAELSAHPERFTPRAWAANHRDVDATPVAELAAAS